LDHRSRAGAALKGIGIQPELASDQSTNRQRVNVMANDERVGSAHPLERVSPCERFYPR